MVNKEVVGLVEEKKIIIIVGAGSARPTNRKMKALLKPTILKIVLTFVLFILSSWLWRIYIVSRISDTFPHGFPLQFYLAWGPCPPNEICFEFNGLYLIIDLMVWYIVGAFVVHKFQRK